MKQEQQRIVSIQAVRAIAFILVFLSHVELIPTGGIGVSLFLVISGFCMTYSYLDRPEKLPEPGLASHFRFVKGKIRKLYPLHLTALLLVAAVIFAGLFIHKAPGKEIAEQSAYFAANGLLLQSWIPWKEGYFSFNAVSWYLSTLAFSYFVFPWVFRTIQSRDRKRIGMLAGVTLALMIAVSVILGIGKQNWGWTNALLKWVTYICPVYRAGDFIIGLTAGYYFVTVKNTWGKGAGSIAEAAVVAVMTGQVVIRSFGVSNTSNWMLSLFWLPTSVIAVYLFAVNKGILSKTLAGSRALVWIGNVSAEAFLIHQICIKAVEYVTKNKWIVAAAAFVLTMICTVIWRALFRKLQQRPVKNSV
ncbi:MAG: acyltransferase [Lachnospiraceae bacterium]|nr:acyltransferase [Lachnospiraceae bacterium]